ncbi:MAG: 5-oxoprolinase subunit PxpB [Rhizobiaceae bacterium]
MPYPRILPYGDAAILVEYGDTIDRDLNARVMALDAVIDDLALDGVLETMPSFRSLMIRFDPMVTDHAILENAVMPHAHKVKASAKTGRHWKLPVCYDAAIAPDLDEVAERTGLTTGEITRLHSETELHVYMIGFLPGHPYLGDLPDVLNIPRRSNPRTRVPRGSVAIAIGMSVIYPVESPGGWSIIGRTPVPLFSFDSQNPSLFAPGDRIDVAPVDKAEFDRIETAIAAGKWTANREMRG